MVVVVGRVVVEVVAGITTNKPSSSPLSALMLFLGLPLFLLLSLLLLLVNRNKGRSCWEYRFCVIRNDVPSISVKKERIHDNGYRPNCSILQIRLERDDVFVLDDFSSPNAKVIVVVGFLVVVVDVVVVRRYYHHFDKKLYRSSSGIAFCHGGDRRGEGVFREGKAG